MNEIVLAGCPLTSLAGYMKGLGVLRLVTEQLDGSARACWRSGHLFLLSRATRDELESFFLHTYTPTPIISPWSGRAGFLEGEEGDESTRKGATTLRALARSTGARFRDYRKLVEAVERVSVIAALDRARPEIKKLQRLDQSKKLDEAGRAALKDAQREMRRLKDDLVVSLRSELEDACLPWIDACFALVEGEARSAPLLGSGGNEGSMDFSTNHVSALLDLIDPDSDGPTVRSAPMLRHALFAQTQVVDATTNIGFLDVAAAGGANMSTGFDASAGENLWTGVLVLEGAVLFGASTTKKLESGERAGLAFPFTVQPTLAGEGSIGTSERAKPELWLPSWTRPASTAELERLFSEGRSTLGARQARSGLDMLAALSGLGIDRGVCGFERFGFFERRGKGYFVATHLGSYKAPQERADSFIAGDLKRHRWLNTFSQFAGGKNTPNRFVNLRRQLEDRLFELSSHDPKPAELQSLLVLLGDIQHATARSSKAREAVAPIPRLSERWVTAADDGTPEFRIAKALAGLRGAGDVALPLRAQIFPVQARFDRWMAPEADETVRLHVGRSGRLTKRMATWLDRRLWLMQKLDLQDKPLSSPAGAMLDDVTAFLRDDRMDARILALLPGLSLCEIPQDTERGAGDGRLPAAFGLMKLALTPGRDLRSLGRLAEGEQMPAPAGLPATLMAGNPGNRAAALAWRRLRASGLTPRLGGVLPALAGIDSRRAAAALLIPLRWAATAALARMLLEEPEARTAPATSTD